MDVFYEIMQKYPLLSSWNEKKYWTGFVNIEGCLLRLALKVPNFPLVHGGELSGNTETQLLCRPLTGQIEGSMADKELSVSKFLEFFVNLIATSDGLKKKTSSISNAVDDQFYSALMMELEKIGLENIAYAAPDYREVHLKHQDSSGNEHTLKCQLPNRYPNAALKVYAELPCLTEKFVWPNKLVEVYKYFKSQIHQFQDFWFIMDELDQKTCVIDPPKPNRAHAYRRITIQERVLVHLVVNPLQPRKLPEITFTGPEKSTTSLESLLQTQCKKWNEECSILRNLENILELTFLEKPSENATFGDNSLKCTICYMYDFEGITPERACDCGSLYHNRCLYDLFLSEVSTAVRKCVDCPVCGNELKIIIAQDQ